ncbi:N-acetyltransferase [Geothrix rubra]|uniref:N-acetyltransferase n=1 Tax=Geothrix rubra TaxID=2927977 RepID=A0ABQ5Q222_9BACT|nr:GNAT family N-acetyltransferase [Geothrix rubra]GLH68797.1 N-acetyltransferase [Geothrix rubra]
MGVGFLIREARHDEFDELGRLMVAVYAGLVGFPGPEEQPRYYDLLTHIGRMAEKPGAKLLVAVAEGRILGGVVHFSDMAQYGSGGSATGERDASGFRLLAVGPDARGMGVGKALVQRCIDFAKEEGHGQVILHSTEAMKVAWGMYERLGFERSPDLDFLQGELPVFGFRLRI